MVKNLPAVQETQVRSLGWEDPQEGNGYPLQYSGLRTPWTEEPGRLQSWGRKESDSTERLTISCTSSPFLTPGVSLLQLGEKGSRGSCFPLACPPTPAPSYALHLPGASGGCFPSVWPVRSQERLEGRGERGQSSLLPAGLSRLAAVHARGQAVVRDHVALPCSSISWGPPSLAFSRGVHGRHDHLPDLS